MSAAKVVQPSPDFRGLRPLSRGMTFSPRPLNASISRLSSRASLPRQTATMEPARLSVSSTPLSLSQSSIMLKPGLSVVEIESLLRERVRSKFNDLKLVCRSFSHAKLLRFRHMCVDQSMSITKGELRRVLETFCFPLTTDQFDAILAKCQLNPNGTLRYTDFLEKFYGKEHAGKDAAKWLSGIHKYNQTRSPMEVSVDKLERELKDKIGSNLKNFVKACRLFDYNRDGKIQRHELRKVLENYCFRMTDQQFDKLWHRYDFQHTGVVEYTEFLRRLGVYVHKHNAVAPDSTMLALNWQQVEEERKKQVAKQALQHKSDKVVEGMTFEQIEKELRKKMKSNYSNVKKAFLAFDATNSGYISIDDLKSVLVHFTIPMSDQLFSQLMDRLRIKASGKVAWEHFLEKFQDPQADGNGQTIPIKPEANRKVNPIREAEGVPHISEVIEKLRKHILDGYSTIKQAFLVFDDDRDGKVSRKELRKIIESFTFRMTDEQFKELMIILDPLHEGFISYKKFLDLFEPQEKVEAHKWLFSTHKYNAQQPPAILAWDTVEDILREKLTENWNAMLGMYQSFDPDATGTITRRELRRILDTFGLPVSDEHFEKMWHGCQENVHGNIAFGEFLAKLGVDAKPGDLQGLSTQVHEESYAREERRRSDQNLRINETRYRINDIEKNAARRTSKMTADEVILKLQDQMSQKDVQIRKTFLRYNKTGKGRVSKKDFKHILEDNGMFMDTSQFNSLCNRLGFFNGFLQYTDFIAAFEDRRHGGPASDIMRSGNHRVNSTNVRYMSAEEVEEQLRTKLREGFNDLQETFLKMDETKSQSITRNDFRKLLDSFMFIMTDEEFNRLMARLQIGKKSKMTFQDFLAKFQETEGPESHPWLNSTHTWNRPNDPAEMACDQVHEILKAKAENAWTDIAKAFKQFDRDGNGIITKKELRNVLFRFTLPLKSSEFNKLWARYDVDQKGYLTHGEFVEVLGLTFAPSDMHGTSRRIVDDSQAFLDQHHQGQQARHQQIAANQMKAAGHMTAAEVEQQLNYDCQSLTKLHKISSKPKQFLTFDQPSMHYRVNARKALETYYFREETPDEYAREALFAGGVIPDVVKKKVFATREDFPRKPNNDTKTRDALMGNGVIPDRSPYASYATSDGGILPSQRSNDRHVHFKFSNGDCPSYEEKYNNALSQAPSFAKKPSDEKRAFWKAGHARTEGRNDERRERKVTFADKVSEKKKVKQILLGNGVIPDAESESAGHVSESYIMPRHDRRMAFQEDRSNRKQRFLDAGLIFDGNPNSPDHLSKASHNNARLPMNILNKHNSSHPYRDDQSDRQTYRPDMDRTTHSLNLKNNFPNSYDKAKPTEQAEDDLNKHIRLRLLANGIIPETYMYKNNKTKNSLNEQPYSKKVFLERGLIPDPDMRRLKTTDVTEGRSLESRQFLEKFAEMPSTPDYYRDKFREYYQDFDKAFRKVDYNKDGTVDIRELQRVLIEHNFFLEEEQFFELLDRLGLSPEKGKLSYPDFLKAIDDGRASKYGRRRSPVNIEEYDGLPAEKSLEKLREKVASNFIVVEKVQEAVSARFYAFARSFAEVDYAKIGVVAKEDFRDILNKNAIRLSDDQFDQLWESMPVNEFGNVVYREFLKQFSVERTRLPEAGPSPPPTALSETPSAMVFARRPATASTPKSGRMSVMSDRPSTRMSRPFTPLVNAQGAELRMKDRVFRHWKDIHHSIVESFNIYLAADDLDQLRIKYDMRNNGKFSYKAFLRHFLLRLKPQQEGILQRKKLQTPRFSVQQGAESSLLYDAMLRMRDVIMAEWQRMRRTFRAIDAKGEGFVSPVDFRQVLKEYGINLSEEEFFHLMTFYDKGMVGKISYNDFLRAYLSQ
ncbi:EF-hand calcium-binding domain-containing protein 6-like [Branchiostoma floridae]|uniref:EF-hand calcium-binding domain-containing protein 6-like n=1 Tax=Branchiostoma floridae TaxID=7739 RepID=A0A9J7HSW8_BRAFL|nr:EF-hand calcium-binding domain-containing protein 6-like [Branchiostoma floridae]